MRFQFLNRTEELRRIKAVLERSGQEMVCVYGRRRLGKSRLITEAIQGLPAVYYVGDERDAPIQRASLAQEIGLQLPGFEHVTYPGWEQLLQRWWSDAPPNAVLVIDEFPYLVESSPELPSLLQKLIDRPMGNSRKLVLSGSSQRMMLGLLLDQSAPLYGRATELMKLQPLAPALMKGPLKLRSDRSVVEHYAAWGGVPRYWELAADHPGLWAAIEHLVLNPLGVLYHEPEAILLDDLKEIARASSILSLVGRGCGRLSEIAGRLGVPATSLSRPIRCLVELGLLERQTPWGTPPRSSKTSIYLVADPLLKLWYRFVEPNRSRLERGQMATVREVMQRAWRQYLGDSWEKMARDSVARATLLGSQWFPAQRWWGAGTNRTPLELDILAESTSDPGTVLVGEVKLSASAKEAKTLLEELGRKAALCPKLKGKQVVLGLWVLDWKHGKRLKRTNVFGVSEVIHP